MCILFLHKKDIYCMQCCIFWFSLQILSDRIFYHFTCVQISLFYKAMQYSILEMNALDILTSTRVQWTNLDTSLSIATTFSYNSFNVSFNTVFKNITFCVTQTFLCIILNTVRPLIDHTNLS